MKFVVDPFTETYNDVAKLLSSLVKQWAGKLDPEEARSLANLGFVRAYHSYDLNKGTFAGWVCQKVIGYLQSGKTRQQVERRRTVVTGYDLDTFPKEEPEKFRVEDFTFAMSQDAKEIVMMALHPTKKVKKLVKEFGRESEINYRMAMRQVLVERGWTERRIKRTFKEVKEAL